MSNTARKSRKRDGIKFERTEKVGTPLEERSIPIVTKIVRRVTTQGPSNSAARRLAKRQEFLEKFSA